MVNSLNVESIKGVDTTSIHKIVNMVINRETGVCLAESESGELKRRISDCDNLFDIADSIYDWGASKGFMPWKCSSSNMVIEIMRGLSSTTN